MAAMFFKKKMDTNILCKFSEDTFIFINECDIKLDLKM